MSLLIKNVELAIDEKKILSNINLELKPGEVHVIMGPNGSGKSTLAGLIAGNPKYNIRNGYIELNKFDITKQSPDVRAKQGIFLSMQNPPEIPGIRIRNFLHTCWQTLTGNKENLFLFNERLKKIAKELNLEEDFLIRDLNVGFSGGERKKLEILQLLILNPSYVILDEIDSGLDADALKTISKAIKNFFTSKKSLLIITHHNKILEYIKPDFVHVMINGNIVKTGDFELAKSINKIGYKNYF